jgi:transcriptional regulator with XRE-family HTH domain/predicted RNase H-like HicB family nuclease
MHYAAYISREGQHVLAEFPDCPGCQTFADSGDEIAAAAHEALEGWLEAHLVDGQVPPRPVERMTAPAGMKLARINVRPGLTAALLIRWARQDAGLSQKELGERAGVRQQQITKLENPDENPTLETLEKVGKALGLDVQLGFEPPERVSIPAVAARVRPQRRLAGPAPKAAKIRKPVGA